MHLNIESPLHRGANGWGETENEGVGSAYLVVAVFGVGSRHGKMGQWMFIDHFCQCGPVLFAQVNGPCQRRSIFGPQDGIGKQKPSMRHTLSMKIQRKRPAVAQTPEKIQQREDAEDHHDHSEEDKEGPRLQEKPRLGIETQHTPKEESQSVFGVDRDVLEILVEKGFLRLCDRYATQFDFALCGDASFC